MKNNIAHIEWISLFSLGDIEEVIESNIPVNDKII